MFDERNDGLRGPFRMNHAGSVDHARVGHTVKRLQNAIRLRLREADFDARGAAGMRLQITGRAEGDDLAVIDDGYTVAEAFGFLDVVGGHYQRFLFALELFNDVVDFAA